MKNYWFTSDTHFFHGNMLKFTKDDGERVRPWNSLGEQHEVMVSNWNKVVSDTDYVYHLGDVTFQYDGKFNELMSRLKGRKRLIVGNHDKMKNPSLFKHFEKVELWKGFKEHNFTATHIPCRLDCLRDGVFNVHGHVHHRTRKEKEYINVCVEVRNYTPVNLDEILTEIKERS